MPRLAEKADPLAEAEKKGMVISEPYSIPGRGEIRVATDRQFYDYQEFAKYVYEHRHDPARVRFINPNMRHVYLSGKEQDIIAREIAMEEGVYVGPASFREEKEKAEEAERPREETMVFFVRYGGSPVRIEVDVSQMGWREREELRADVDELRHRPRGEEFARLENDFSRFLEEYLSDITNITVEVGEGGRKRRVSVRLDEGTLSEINSLTRHA